jgi:hypothetical protein
MESRCSFFLTVVTKYILDHHTNKEINILQPYENSNTGNCNMLLAVAYLTPVPVFLRKLLCSQQTVKHAKIHLQEMKYCIRYLNWRKHCKV